MHKSITDREEGHCRIKMSTQSQKNRPKRFVSFSFSFYSPTQQDEIKKPPKTQKKRGKTRLEKLPKCHLWNVALKKRIFVFVSRFHEVVRHFFVENLQIFTTPPKKKTKKQLGTCTFSHLMMFGAGPYHTWRRAETFFFKYFFCVFFLKKKRPQK